jgi:hypothetical protein
MNVSAQDFSTLIPSEKDDLYNPSSLTHYIRVYIANYYKKPLQAVTVKLVSGELVRPIPYDLNYHSSIRISIEVKNPDGKILLPSSQDTAAVLSLKNALNFIYRKINRTIVI